MNIKRAVFMAVLVVAVAALAMPLVGLRASASCGGLARPSVIGADANAAAAPSASTASAVLRQETGRVRERGGGTQRKLRVATYCCAPDDTADLASTDALESIGIMLFATQTAKVGQTVTFDCMLLRSWQKPGDKDSSTEFRPQFIVEAHTLVDELIAPLGGRGAQTGGIPDFDTQQEDYPQVGLPRESQRDPLAIGFDENSYCLGNHESGLWVDAYSCDGTVIKVLGQTLSPASINRGITLPGTGTNHITDPAVVTRVRDVALPAPAVPGEIVYVYGVVIDRSAGEGNQPRGFYNQRSSPRSPLTGAFKFLNWTEDNRGTLSRDTAVCWTSLFACAEINDVQPLDSVWKGEGVRGTFGFNCITRSFSQSSNEQTRVIDDHDGLGMLCFTQRLESNVPILSERRTNYANR